MNPLRIFVALTVAASPAIALSKRLASSVTIVNGTINGVDDAEAGVQRFLGIPYAQPPTGDLRLRQAQPINYTFESLDARKFGHACYGTRDQPDASEDCLTLNIWRPSEISTNSSLPVLVWLFGGGLTNGYTSDPRFEGTNMVRISTEIGKPVVLVSINYRLASLGFLNGRQMAELGLLNIGMLDQRLGLHWIQENIAAFGGDPSKVTLFGQSAGAVSTYSHMIAYGGRDDGLFRAAILQSGGAFPLTYPNTTSFQETFDSLITNTSCSGLADSSATRQLECIRKLPIDVFRSSVGSSTGQSIDGTFTQTSVQLALPAGKFVRIPVIVGTNTDVGTTSAPTGINTTDDLLEPLSAAYFRPKSLPTKMVQDILSLYPTAPALGCPYNTGSRIFTTGKLDKLACSIFGDVVQVAPARLIASSLAQAGVPVWRYRWNHLQSNTSGSDVWEGITTGVEQNFVFSNLLASEDESPSASWERALAYDITSKWISFSWDLNPNFGYDSGAPSWPEYGSKGNSFVFNAFGSSVETDDYRAEGIQYIMKNVLDYGAV